MHAPEVTGCCLGLRHVACSLQGYPHVASGSEDGGASPLPVEVEGWELPSMRGLFWKQPEACRMSTAGVPACGERQRGRRRRATAGGG